MLHFFRKIRHDLIANSKSFRYFKYAIGEVVLVVLGILIAIQINYWNEQRKNNLRKEVYIQRLNHDLARDTINLNNYIASCEKAIRAWRKTERQIDKPNATTDSIIEIATSMGLHPTIPMEELHNSTFNSLLSTGDIDLFQEDHLVMLMDFYAIRERNSSRLLDNQEFSWSFWSDEFNFLFMEDKTSLFYSKQKEKFDEVKFLRTFYSLVKVNSGMMNSNRDVAHYGLVRTREVLKILNNPNENSYSDISYIFK